MLKKHPFLFFLILVLAFPAACRTLRESRPILPVREYERMVSGRIDANYVGTNNCLSACHVHDRIRQDFDASTMGVQLLEKSGMPLVDCESCHGPGSLAIRDLTPERLVDDREAGRKTACDYKTLLNFDTLPAPARSLVCLKCHTANATFNLQEWNAGVHSVNDVSCSDCHDVHAGPDLKVRPRDTAKMCLDCHTQIRSELELTSRHPVLEGKVFCTNCHDPHGSATDHLLREPSVKQTCTACHGDKEGPFLYEHADVTEDCTNCHTPHGSVYNQLLSVDMPFLCLQCHFGHRTESSSSVDEKGQLYTRCTDCHSTIHGTDVPGATGTGRFTH